MSVCAWGSGSTGTAAFLYKETGVPCKCTLCTTFGDAPPRADRASRLRGFEIELSRVRISKLGSGERCKKHGLQKCKKGAKCTLLRSAVGEVECDCDYCKREERQTARGEVPTCPGHPCIGDGDMPAWLTEVMREGLQGVIPIKGTFTEWRHTPRDNPYVDLKTDRSCGYEIVTPPVNGHDMERMLRAVMEPLVAEEQRHGESFVDNSCGLHCSFDVRDLTGREVKRLLFLALRHQEALIGTQPAYRSGNAYCRTIELGRGGRRTVMTTPTVKLATLEVSTHYHFINLSKIESAGIVEFRFGGATLDSATAAAYGTLLECLVESALRARSTPTGAGRLEQLYNEVIRPYMDDKRVATAWERVLEPQLRRANG